ncbi:MAG TPA: thioredoxin [Gemmatimonadaceae bacterium]
MTDDTKRLTLRCQFCDTWNRIDVARAADRPKCGNCGRPILLDRPWVLTEESFDRTISETDVPVLVDFYADWCGPCKMMAPSVDQLAASRTGRALVAKLNTDLAPATSQRFQVRGIPTTIVFREGKESARVTGAVPYAALEKMIP